MTWQGFVRAKARDFERVVVCTTRNREALYADLNPLFVPHELEGLRNCWRLENLTNPIEEKRVRSRLEELDNSFRRTGFATSRLVPNRYIPLSEQHFTKFGDARRAQRVGQSFDLVVHARRRASRDRRLDVLNWPPDLWDEICGKLHVSGIRIAAIGSVSESLLPANCHDLRGEPLGTIMDIIAASTLVAGPSSGPMHLASLCGTPHVVWTIQMQDALWRIWGSSRERYEKIWNPFGTPVRVLEGISFFNVPLITDEILRSLNA